MLDVVLERAPATLFLGSIAFVISLLVGVPLGIVSAIKRGTPLDQFGKVVALIGQSAPPFLLGIVLMFMFAVGLGWLPPYGKESWNSIVLPAITLGWFYAAANLRLIRSSMLDVMDSEYIKLARAKGADNKAVILKHALRNAILPVVALAAVQLGFLLGGSLVIESIFALHGLGFLAYQSILRSDVAVVQAAVLIFSLIFIVLMLLADLLNGYLDPRIRIG